MTDRIWIIVALALLLGVLAPAVRGEDQLDRGRPADDPVAAARGATE